MGKPWVSHGIALVEFVCLFVYDLFDKKER
jgi:hypothetical protein